MSTSILQLINLEINLYGRDILLCLGNIGNVFVVLLFKSHRQNACSFYMLSAAVMNIIGLTLYIALFYYNTYQGDLDSRSETFCKVRYYLYHIWSQMGRYYFVLACIDRYCITSEHAYFRAIGRPTIARRLVGIVYIIWCVLAIHIPILTTNRNGRCSQFDIYYILFNVYITLSIAVIPPLLMAIFGFLAYRQMKQRHKRIHPVTNVNMNRVNIAPVHQRDRQLLVMVLTEALVYTVTMIWYPCIVLEIAMTTYMSVEKSVERLQIENFISSLATSMVYLNFAVPFYIYLAVSKTFRSDLKNLICKVNHRT